MILEWNPSDSFGLQKPEARHLKHHKQGDLKSASWTTARIHKLKATFAKFDANGDGSIAPAELSQVLKSLGFSEEERIFLKILEVVWFFLLL